MSFKYKYKNEINLGFLMNHNNNYIVLNYLYKYIDINLLKYQIFKNTDQIKILKQNNFYIIPHYQGYNYIMLFSDILSNFDVYLISKFDLKNNINEIDFNNIKIYKLGLNPYLSSNLYYLNNTIIDGKIIYNNYNYTFFVIDIFYHNNQKVLNIKIDEKIKNFENEINNLNYYLNNILSFRIIKLYDYTELLDLLYDKIVNSEYRINGLTFIPYRTSKYYLYINDNEFENLKKKEIINKKYISIKYNFDNNEKKKNLILIKTSIIDVYDVFNLEKKFRLGIASVPSLELSKKLRNYFSTKDELEVECIYDNKFKKWLPIF